MLATSSLEGLGILSPISPLETGILRWSGIVAFIEKVIRHYHQ